MFTKVKPLESSTEKSFATSVKARGCLYLKLEVLGFAGMPDRLIVGPRRLVLFIEWKRDASRFGSRKGEKLQAHIHDMLTRFGFTVAVCDNVAGAASAFENELKCGVILNAD